jgi:hypothetical protein
LSILPHFQKINKSSQPSCLFVCLTNTSRAGSLIAFTYIEFEMMMAAPIWTWNRPIVHILHTLSLVNKADCGKKFTEKISVCRSMFDSTYPFLAYVVNNDDFGITFTNEKSTPLKKRF